MSNADAIGRLRALNACDSAIEWLRAQDCTWEEAWQRCDQGDWLLWILGKLIGRSAAPWSVERRPLVFAIAQVLEYRATLLPKDRQGAALSVVQTLVAWTQGHATNDDVMSARSGATAAYATAYATAAYATAYATADAADAAATAADAAATAAYAAAYDASYAAAAYAARRRALAKCADIVRGVFPTAPVLP